jgi:hypothetical protein
MAWHGHGGEKKFKKSQEDGNANAIRGNARDGTERTFLEREQRSKSRLDSRDKEKVEKSQKKKRKESRGVQL